MKNPDTAGAVSGLEGEQTDKSHASRGSDT